ncbi:NEFA-interacting nuclear protein NIP30 [Heracleum sosnowskyi]|uniref:NEFA-interacting nuclear protein NIP30 n=1 Tax=Heracleum sosnowskyi TaxID=360622 RepID=A0AAD8LYY8_9APIA|nr:NEFA-interacting nuclear protein NIP30 [Heracleum sosnowskyi]
MADDGLPPPIRLMNFISEDQLEEAKRTRGARLEDGTAQRDRPLFEVLKENKDKKDAEFNERFKHRPPKALDEDETEFLDRLEMSRREYERQMADEEAEQLQKFQAAVDAQSVIVHEIKEAPPIPKIQEPKKLIGKKNPPLSMIIKVKPQAKKAKVDVEKPSESIEIARSDINRVTPSTDGGGDKSRPAVNSSLTGLVSYSDESDDE